MKKYGSGELCPSEVGGDLTFPPISLLLKNAPRPGVPGARGSQKPKKEMLS